MGLFSGIGKAISGVVKGVTGAVKGAAGAVAKGVQKVGGIPGLGGILGAATVAIPGLGAVVAGVSGAVGGVLKKTSAQYQGAVAGTTAGANAGNVTLTPILWGVGGLGALWMLMRKPRGRRVF